MTYQRILLLPHLCVSNANALSSPFTIGFPAMTAWLGATHALQRKLDRQGINLKITATGVVSHEMDMQTYRGNNDYVSSIVGTGNPLDKDGNRSPFIEEARCHLDVSLLLAVEGIKQEEEHDVEAHIRHLLNSGLKIAGGDIQSFGRIQFFVISDNNKTELLDLTRRIMPGYALIERRDLMIDAMKQGQDAMDALIDYVAIHHNCEHSEDDNVVWRQSRKAQNNKPAGWIVPIATGFHGISELGQAKNQRDSDQSIPHCFAESLVTLGEFRMPHHFSSITEMLWRYQFDKEHSLYQCVVQKSASEYAINEFD